MMMKGGELGEIRDGYLADLLLVDGDPLANISILQDRDKLLAIMKDGVFHKDAGRRRGAAVRALSGVSAGNAKAQSARDGTRSMRCRRDALRSARVRAAGG